MEATETTELTEISQEADLDNDGKVTMKELDIYEQRARHRRAMAWTSLIAAIISGFCLMFLVSESRLHSLDGLLELYWIGLLGITGAYVGVSTWAARRP